MAKLDKLTVHHPPTGGTQVVTRAAFVTAMVANGWEEIAPQPRLVDLLEHRDVGHAKALADQGATVEYRDGDWMVVIPVEPDAATPEPEAAATDLPVTDGLTRPELDRLAETFGLDPDDYARKADLAAAIDAAANPTDSDGEDPLDVTEPTSQED